MNLKCLHGNLVLYYTIFCLVEVVFLTNHHARAFQSVKSSVTRSGSALSGSLSDVAVQSKTIVVAMTREEGKNGKLLKGMNSDAILQGKIEAVELPCISHADGPDLPRLKDYLLESWDYVAITSPEAARVLASVWDGARMSSIKVAAVGKATEKELQDHNINVVFTPSQAYANNLVDELPGSVGTKLLYPASCRAPGTLSDGLTKRGFQVLRLNTYDTVTAEWTEEQKSLANSCNIVCFASPSSIKGWLKNSNNNNKSVIAACIGETSAKACRELGWDQDKIFHADNPGIEGWVDAIRRAVDKLNASEK